jgi:hypothetical protein
VGATLAKYGAALAVGAALAAGGYAVFHKSGTDVGLETAKQAPPDTPPAEFAYLDSARVLAYLGQIEGGLATSQSRTLSVKSTAKGSLTAKDIASAEASTERDSGLSETVTPTEADRFYTLLRILRQDQSAGGRSAFRTLVDLDARVTKANPVARVLRRLGPVQIGDFVRIRHAHAYIPPYAGVLPRARFASYYLGGGLAEPARALYAPVSGTARRAVRDYERALKANPRIPVVVPTLPAEHPVNFFVPAFYRALSGEPSVIGGEVTIVGKVIYADLETPKAPASADSPPPRYFDRETLATFGPALKHADSSLLTRLNLDRADVVSRLRDSLTIPAPVVVVLPVAIYQ